MAALDTLVVATALSRIRVAVDLLAERADRADLDPARADQARRKLRPGHGPRLPGPGPGHRRSLWHRLGAHARQSGRLGKRRDDRVAGCGGGADGRVRDLGTARSRADAAGRVLPLA